MRRALPAVLVLTLLLPAGAAASTTGRLLVTLEPSTGATAAADELAGSGARQSGRSLPQLRALAVRPRGGVRLSALARGLRDEPGVASVEQEQRATLRAVPNDPALSTLEPATGAPAGTPVQWWAQRQGLLGAWDVPEARDATVAIIDTGVDAGHPDLAGRIIGAVDNDELTTTPGTVDENGHGTHVASLACATAGNGVGIAGAGYGCKLLVYKSDLSDLSVARSIVQATDAGADAINMSFGTDGTFPAPTPVRAAVQYAYDRGVVLVAAGADTPQEVHGYPSDVLQPTGTGPDLEQGLGLSVTAANFADQRASFAGFGTQISLAAYGAWNVGPAGSGPRGLMGAFPGQTASIELPPAEDKPGCECRTSFAGDPRYAYLQGTSMAAPIVAASAAMVRDLNPDLTTAEVIRTLKATARRPAGTAWEPNLGWGILDAGAAVATARLVDRRPPATRIQAVKARSTTTLRFRGTDTAPPGVVKSGVARFDLMRSIDGRKATRILRTSRRTARVKLRPGRRYAFWTVAGDRAANREATPRTPDVRLRLPRRG